VTIGVGNAGSRIAPEDREAIFERFRRADGSGAPGAGLGLYISRGLVRAHGGELEVGDVPEGGTRFTFWLPVLDPGEREVRVGPSSGDAIEPNVSHITVPSLGRR
ncbi:MAG TPA: HAMP domain-containing sensor histidine kinase, partial [Actinomycetota bacterium]